MKRTPWFDAMKDEPAYVGEYEFTYCGMLRSGFVFWNGIRWMTMVIPGDKWRGLAEKSLMKGRTPPSQRVAL
jgi:hypothetical protein